MQNFLNIMGEASAEGAFLGTSSLSQILSVVQVAVFGAGVAILISWLIHNKGFKALDSAPARVNKMRLHVPLLQLFIWVILVSLTSSLILFRFGDPLPIQGEYALQIGLLAVRLGMICSILVIAFLNFHGRFKGFGLDFKTFPKDIRWAVVNYIAVIPMVTVCVWVIVFICKLFLGGDFELPKHQSLEQLMQAHISMKIVVVCSAAVVAPIFEELLFRGLIQSALRTHVGKPWPAIILTSLIFVVIHGLGLWSHWLPLMALSICLGYSYEKSGSILRSICIHIIFNSVSVVGTLLTLN